MINLRQDNGTQMKLNHPFYWIRKTQRNRIFVILLILTVVTIIGLQITGNPLKTETSPAGIVSFEFAGTIDNAQNMIKSWGPQGQVYIGLNMGLDFLFLILYPLAIGLGVILVGQRLSNKNGILWSLTVWLAWGLLIAGILDSIENYALIRILLGNTQELWPILAKWSAIPKFAIVLVGLLYILIGGISSILKK